MYYLFVVERNETESFPLIFYFVDGHFNFYYLKFDKKKRCLVKILMTIDNEI